MYSLFESVKPFVKSKPKGDVPKPDSIFSKLHYRATAAILFGCCIVVSTYNYIDKTENPIQCLYDKGTQIEPDVINRFCWVTSTFTLPSQLKGTQGKDMIHPGVGTFKKDDTKEYHAYYQWVPLVLALQALMFYAPHYLWKYLEGGEMRRTIDGLKREMDSLDNAGLNFKQEKADQIETSESKAKISKAEIAYKGKLEDFANFLHTRSVNNVGKNAWSYYIRIIELVNLLQVLLQMLITNWFLDGEFTTYGTEVINFPYMDPEERIDPMSRIFPRMTKCIFHLYGPSGTIKTIDSLCVLSMNIVNEKIFIFLWFWFIFLAISSAIEIAIGLYNHFQRNQNKYLDKLLVEGYRSTPKLKHQMELLHSRLSDADWLVVFFLAQSLEQFVFLDLITVLASKLRGEHEPEPRALQDKSAKKDLLPTSLNSND